MSFNYSDPDNIHDSYLQQKTRDGLSQLVKDKLTISFIEASEYLEKHGLPKDFVYDTTTTHVITGLTMREIITYIVNRIIIHREHNEILDLLVYMMKSSRLACFTGQITNWIGVLSYYFSDISIDISKYDRINNYLDYLKIHYMDDVLYEKFVSFLNESDITELERESYVEALLEYIAEENNKPLSDRIAYRNMYERNLYYKNILNVMQVLSSIDDTSREIYDRNNVSTHILPRLINGAIYKPMTKSYDNVIVIDYKLLYSHHAESEVINTDTHLEYELMPKLPKKTHTFPKHFKGHIYYRTPYYNKKSYNNKKLFSKNYR